MDAPPFEHLRRFFERIKSAGFFERLFSWQGVVSAGYDAFSEYQQLQQLIADKEQELASLAAKNRELAQSLWHLQQQADTLRQDLLAERGQVQLVSQRLSEKEQAAAQLAEALANSEDEVLRVKGEVVAHGAKNEDLQNRINEREKVAGGLTEADKKNRELIQKMNADLAALTARYDQMNLQYTESQKLLSQLRQNEESRTREHDARVTELMALKKQLEDDRLRVQAERDEEIRKEFAGMEQSWKRHEEAVEASIRNICQRHTLEYCDKEKFPYTGKPDNAVLILDQFVIFDAKSPKNPDELSNFPQYIKTQAEAAKKYLKGADVRKEIYLVVPANTVEYLDDFHYDLADLQVYVVTHDCLEPLILALRKIEEYEFAEKLSPEDRESICRVIGKFAHATKRRIQIDNYFSNEFIDLLQSCDNLPDEIKQKVLEIEMAEKLNPPQEKRKKKIPIRDLEHDVKVIGKEAEAREIDVTAVTKEKIETITLTKYLE